MTESTNRPSTPRLGMMQPRRAQPMAKPPIPTVPDDDDAITPPIEPAPASAIAEAFVASMQQWSPTLPCCDLPFGRTVTVHPDRLRMPVKAGYGYDKTAPTPAWGPWHIVGAYDQGALVMRTSPYTSAARHVLPCEYAYIGLDELVSQNPQLIEPGALVHFERAGRGGERVRASGSFVTYSQNRFILDVSPDLDPSGQLAVTNVTVARLDERLAPKRMDAVACLRTDQGSIRLDEAAQLERVLQDGAVGPLAPATPLWLDFPSTGPDDADAAVVTALPFVRVGPFTVDDEAIAKATTLAEKHRVTTPLPDGFFMVTSWPSRITEDGHVTQSPKGHEVVVLHRQLDPLLPLYLSLVSKYKSGLDKASPETRLQAATMFMGLLAGQMRSERAGFGRKALDWGDRHHGQPLFLGAVPSLGGGLCTHRALMFAVLAEAAGIQAAIRVGEYRGDDQEHCHHHAWNEITIDGQLYVIDGAQADGVPWDPNERLHDGLTRRYVNLGSTRRVYPLVHDPNE